MSTFAIVVGAAGSIGSAVARQLSRRGVKVEGIDLVQLGGPRPSGVHQHRCDASDTESVRTCYQQIVRRGGDPSMLVACPGIFPNRPLTSYTADDIRLVMSSNFYATVNFVWEALRERAQSKAFRIVLVSSLAGHFGGRDAFYAASKAAVNAFMKSIAREFGGSGVRCNCIAPGPTRTPMNRTMSAARQRYYKQQIPIGRFIEPQEVADLCTYLLLEAPDALNGATIDLDGGLIRR